MSLRPTTVLTLSLLVSACGQSSGSLSAEHTGTIVTDLAPRRAPDLDFKTRCGDGAATEVGRSTLQRAPFLQQVTSTGGIVVFRTLDAAPVEIEVTDLDGRAVLRVASETDPNAGSGQQLGRIAGLQPSTAYCYSLRGLTAGAGFVTAPSPDHDRPVRFAAFGDSGSGNADQLAIFEQLETVPFDFIMHTGDLAYESGTPAELERTVFHVYEPLLRSFALFPVMGNHDYGTRDADPYLQSFVLPENGSSDALERWYSFDWGNVHFVALDTERIGAIQAAWLDEDLAENRLPWTVVYGHRPPFSSGKHGGNAAFRRELVPILERHRVALVLSGHDHDYERTEVLNGVTYVVTGGGGRENTAVGRSSFTAFSESALHFVFVEVIGTRLVLHAIDGVGREFDQTVIERTPAE